MILWLFVFFNVTSTTEIYTLSLHDALPILAARFEATSRRIRSDAVDRVLAITGGHPYATQELAYFLWQTTRPRQAADLSRDRKSTRLNSSHANISYAVFCLKKKIIYLLNYR